MLDIVRLRVLAAVARQGSVTKAARELHYSQPSVSHHLAKLEAETGAKLVQRAGRGIRLTEAGRLLADRAIEIVGRVDSATAELSAHVGLRAGRVRLAAFPSALGTFAPEAAALLTREHPALELGLTETEPPEALRMLRAGYVDVAVIFRYDDTAPEDNGIRLVHLLDDPSYLVVPEGPAGVPPPPRSPRNPVARGRTARHHRPARNRTGRNPEGRDRTGRNPEGRSRMIRTAPFSPTAAPAGSRAATGAGATCSTCARGRASNRRSLSPATTSWRSRPWSPREWG
nr:hypothetical protein GCM10020093_095020 [Planobispora longispora]